MNQVLNICHEIHFTIFNSSHFKKLYICWPIFNGSNFRIPEDIIYIYCSLMKFASLYPPHFLFYPSNHLCKQYYFTSFIHICMYKWYKSMHINICIQIWTSRFERSHGKYFYDSDLFCLIRDLQLCMLFRKWQFNLLNK